MDEMQLWIDKVKEADAEYARLLKTRERLDVHLVTVARNARYARAKVRELGGGEVE